MRTGTRIEESGLAEGVLAERARRARSGGSMKRAGWLVLVLVLAFAGAVEAAGRAVAVIVDVTGEVTVNREGGARALTAYVGMDLFEGDRLVAAGPAEVTAFYESGGTAKMKVASPVVVGAAAPVAQKPGVLSRLGASLSDLFGTSTEVRTEEAGAVEAGLIIARVAEEDLESKSAAKDVVARELLPDKLEGAAQSVVDRRPEPGAPPAPSEERPGQMLERAPSDGLGRAGKSLPARPGGAAAPADEPPGRAGDGRSGSGFTRNGLAPQPLRPSPLDAKSGGGGTVRSRALPRRSGGWLPGLGLESALARVRLAPQEGTVPALAGAPAAGSASVSRADGRSVGATDALADGATATLRVRPAEGGAWSFALTIAPAAEFARVLADARALAGGDELGSLLAARMLDKRGFRIAAYLVQRKALLKLRAQNRPAVVLRRLTHQVAERALELGDFATVAQLRADR